MLKEKEIHRVSKNIFKKGGEVFRSWKSARLNPSIKYGKLS